MADKTCVACGRVTPATREMWCGGAGIRHLCEDHFSEAVAHNMRRDRLRLALGPAFDKEEGGGEEE